MNWFAFHVCILVTFVATNPFQAVSQCSATPLDPNDPNASTASCTQGTCSSIPPVPDPGDPGITVNIFGSRINTTLYVTQNGFQILGTSIPIVGDVSDLELLKKRLEQRNSAAKSATYFSYTLTDSVVSTAYTVALLPFRQPRAENPMASSIFVLFAIVLTTLLIYWFRVFHLGVLGMAVTLLVVAWRFSSAELSADLKSAGFLSMLCALLALMHFSYGQVKGHRAYNPAMLIITQYLFTVGLDLMFLCDQNYYFDNALWLILVVSSIMTLVTIFTSNDSDSSRGASFFFLMSLLSQTYYFFVMMIRSKVFAPPTLVAYYEAGETIILSSGSFVDKLRDFNFLLSSGLLHVATKINGGVDKQFDVAGSVIVMILIMVMGWIYSTFNVFVNYFHYSLRISKSEADKRVALPLQYVFGVCRYFIDVITNLLGISGNSLFIELQRFNAGLSSFSGAMYIASSLAFDSFAVFNPRFVIGSAIVVGLVAYVIVVVLTNDAIRELFSMSVVEPTNMSFDQKMALLASGRQYIPHAYSPYVGLNTGGLAASAVKPMTFESDTGAKSNCVPIADNKFLICMHQLLSNINDQNISSFTVRDVVGKIISIGSAGKFKILEVFVPFQKSNVPDRVICCKVDKVFAANWLKPENVQTFTSALDCVVFSRNRVDPREGRTLSCSSKDVFMHTIPLEPGDSGGLLTALNGRALGIHSGSHDAQRMSYAFRLDTLLPQLMDDSRRADPKANSSILALSESRAIT